MKKHGPIGIFDSGVGGLTIMKEVLKGLPEYDYMYLGDNARAPYGTRSFDSILKYTLECCNYLFEKGCRLIILACNTASAKALRTIQQNYLSLTDSDRRVLGILRPTTETVGLYTQSRHIGILGTPATISSDSYVIEINRFFPDIEVFQQACPMWVPLVENMEYDNPGADYFVEKYLTQLFLQSGRIDTLVLACTHYPFLYNKIRQFIPSGTTILNQGTIVASALKNYLVRHPEIEKYCSKNHQRSFYTTDAAIDFERKASIFFEAAIKADVFKI